MINREARSTRSSKNKYGNQKVLLTASMQMIKASEAKPWMIAEAKWFDSKMEAEFFRDMIAPGLRDGTISDVQLQPTYVLLDKFEKKGIKHRAITYTPDFLITERDGSRIAIDVKGMEDQKFPIKRKLFDYRYPDIPLIIMKKVVKYGGWITAEQYVQEKRKEKKAEKANAPRLRRSL